MIDPTCILYVAEESGVFVGTGRVERLKDRSLISWAVAPGARGRGVGKMIVKTMCYEISGTICAEIKMDNLASINIAKAIGMKLYKEVDGVLYFIKD
jgi:RimJ/RimL family protein N-acetyltransferase